VTGRYLLALETSFMDRPPGPDDVATIGLIDTSRDNTWRPVARTRAWNWQQGAMLQWLPSGPDRLIIYNDRRKDRFVAVIHDIVDGGEQVLPRPVYALRPEGDVALSTNFSRIAHTRPGYGYVGLADRGRHDPHPENDGIHRIDLDTGESHLIISYRRVADLPGAGSMEGARHWVNHIQISPDGSRFAFLHRWTPRGQLRPWKTRLFTADFDGSDLSCIADHEMVSHYDWRDPEHILAWARQSDVGDRFFLFTDGTGQREVVGEGVLSSDGHCSYSPDRRWLLTDTYPDAEQMRTLILYRPEDGRRVDIGRFHAPPKLQGEIRCDLHPRWSRDGRSVSFDSAHQGTRQMYVVDVSDIVASE